jgi:1-aminocyclopropane-1-carboxylate deaminase/D-cysteine desulfhydrase-like pyridoxal-dependent ACC family enzyme
VSGRAMSGQAVSGLVASGLDASVAGVGRIVVPPRTRLAVLPTPLVSAPRLAGAMGTGSLHIKRDDLTGFAIAGNKARPLEFLIADASREHAGTIVTGGAPGSNFCAAAAAAALRAGLACHLVIAGDPAPAGPGLALALSWGATVTWTHAADRGSVDAALPHAAADVAARGGRPYLIPRGGATALGAVGYALAAFELHRQLAERGIGPASVVVAVGSGGTMAGIVAGNVLLGRPWTLVGASVSRPAQEASRQVLTLAGQCVRMLTPAAVRPAGVSPADAEIVDARGPGHGRASPEGNAAAHEAMRTEGLMVDPVYTAKALSLVGRRAATESVIFWQTGGLLDAVAAAAWEQR